MSERLAMARWPACTSALRLDRWLGGELSAAEAAELETHLAACVPCAEAARTLRAGREQALPPLRARVGGRVQPVAPAPPPGPGRRRAWAVAAGLATALAAGLLLVPGRERPDGAAAGDRLKGAGVGLSMFVQHGAEVRRAGPGEVVAPGDSIRFAVTTPVAAYVAVLSLDPLGHASVYFPGAARAEPIGPGLDLPLPAGTRLDATVGEERVWALFCPWPVDLEPVRAGLEGGRGTPPVPDGCLVSPWRFVKRSP